MQTLTAAVPAPSSRRALMAWLLRAQLRVVQHEIWLASALVMTLGVLVTLTRQPGLSAEMLPLALIAPLVAALGITFLYGPAADPSLEIELATPISPRLIVLVRLLLVFLFDLALGLIGSVALVIANSEWSLWPLVSLWLAPMTFLAALAFLLSMLFVDPLIGVSICLTVWGLQVLRVFPPFATLPNWLSDDLQPLLWLTAVLCVGLALWLAGREERQLLKRI
ncbi:MAG: hypothetical protein HGB05_19035 [Chloroflexi bacterium]|nr:hypothetical protein [Chloroflexota bacterium]